MALELATLAVLTPVYLLGAPHRPVWLDAGLGLAAVVVVVATARHTRERIWEPPATERRARLRHSPWHMLVATSSVALLFANDPASGAFRERNAGAQSFAVSACAEHLSARSPTSERIGCDAFAGRRGIAGHVLRCHHRGADSVVFPGTTAGTVMDSR